MLAIEICYELLKQHFDCGPAPLPEGENLENGYVTYQDVSTVPQESTAGWLGYDQVRVQVNVYHREKLQAVKNSNFIKRLFTKQNPYGGCSAVAERSDHDEETMLYVQQIDFYLHQSDNSC